MYAVTGATGNLTADELQSGCRVCRIGIHRSRMKIGSILLVINTYRMGTFSMIRLVSAAVTIQTHPVRIISHTEKRLVCLRVLIVAAHAGKRIGGSSTYTGHLRLDGDTGTGAWIGSGAIPAMGYLKFVIDT